MKQTKKGERKMSKRANNVPKSLYNNIHRVLPMVVNKELPMEELQKSLESRGYAYQAKILLKFITSYFFRRRLVEFLEVLEDDTDPEYYIELYLFP